MQRFTVIGTSCSLARSMKHVSPRQPLGGRGMRSGPNVQCALPPVEKFSWMF